MNVALSGTGTTPAAAPTNGTNGTDGAVGPKGDTGNSEIGQRIVAAAPALGEIAPLVRATHERFDGSGYPDGVAAHELPLAARIVGVWDAYDAMITGLPYQRAMDGAAALQELRRCAGTQFDPDVVDTFGLVLLDDAALLLHDATA